MTEAPTTFAPINPISELFTKSMSALWATTFNVDLTLFNEFLLRRLGDPPLNIVVLADHRRLTSSLERISSEGIDTLALVNSRWLLRGFRPGGQAFHPKSYLAVAGKRVVLLVGSGNLSSNGLSDGHEVFTSFRSGTQVGDLAIASWHLWMRQIVEMVGDVILAERFRHLSESLSISPAILDSRPLLHNLNESIADQLIATIKAEAPGPVDELLLAAPFYDADAYAVARLLADLKPQHVIVYVTKTTSVNGVRLSERLTESGARVDVQAYEPERFVHAKLIGITAGGKGWLLSGSANLSQVGLIRSTHNGGNVELAVLARLESDQIPAMFVPPGMTTVAQSFDSLASLSVQSSEENKSVYPAVHLITATVLPEDRIETLTNPPCQCGWFLEDFTERQPLLVESSGRTITAGALSGRLVRVVDVDGKILSNRVVADNPNSLKAMLMASAEHSSIDKPQELLAGDLNTPLGQTLTWLHQNLVMDVTERLTNSPAGGGTIGENDDQTNDDLWERLVHEQLANDHRANSYSHIWSRNFLAGTEPIIDLLDTLRSSTAKYSSSGLKGRSLLLHLLDRKSLEDKQTKQPSLRWKSSARIRVRALNVLRRWADAMSDERLVWVDPLAPAGNFAMITFVLAHLHLELTRDPQRVELTRDDLNDIWLRWLREFAGTGEANGWLNRLESSDLAFAKQRIPEWVAEDTAALCWLAICHSSDRTLIIKWQPVIASALKHGLLEPNEATARFVSVVSKITITRAQVDSQLMAVMEFIDDELWCTRTNLEMQLDGLEIRSPPTAEHLQLRIDVHGIPNPLMDTRVIRLIIAARNYRRCDGIALYAADSTWRIVASTGRRIAYLPTHPGKFIESTIPITTGFLERLAGSGGVLATVFPNTAVV